MAFAKSFRELEVYRLARVLANDIYQLSTGFPSDERFSLTDQIRRSSRAVGAQIAEAWAKRRYKKHFISKLTDADGEQLETQHWTESAQDCKLLSNQKALELISKYEILGKKLYVMMNKAEQFGLNR